MRLMRVFVDTAWNSKLHTCYDSIADKFFEVERLTELRNYDEIFLDSMLFPQIWTELRELVMIGCRIWYFTRPWRWRELRNRFSNDLKRRLKAKDVRKTDFGDAYLLWKVYEVSVAKGNLEKWFRRITPIDIELRPLLTMERVYERWLRKACQYEALGVDMGADINLFRDKLEGLRRVIVAKARELWPRFMEVAMKLGLDKDDLGGLTGLAGTLTYLGWPLRKPSMHKAIRYFGLYKPSREDKLRFMERTGRRFQRHYSGSARRYLNLLTTAILTKERRFPPKTRDEAKTLKKLIGTLRQLELAGV